MVESDGEPSHLSGVQQLSAQLWAMLGGDPRALRQLRFTPVEEGLRPRLLPSVYDVISLATASIGVATLAVAELWTARTGRPASPGGELPEVVVDPVEAAAAFRSEALLEPVGWALPPIWDSIAGIYAGTDGYVRLHTNYAHHRAAALAALGFLPAESDGGPDRAAVAQRVASFGCVDVETRVVAAGGCAAAMRDRQGWARHEHGRIGAGQAPVVMDTSRGTCRTGALRVLTWPPPTRRPVCWNGRWKVYGCWT